MDSASLIGIAAFVVLLLGTLGIWQHYVEKAARRRVVEAVEECESLGTAKPLAQGPIIDPMKCIGCATCVHACPEEGVLEVVEGIARIVHGSRCIGHSKCEEMCPVGALTVGIEDMSSRPDIPQLSPEFETNLEGIFIAGELGGYSLIRNAIQQGMQVLETVGERMTKGGAAGSDPNVLDVLIVGSGPAGVAATLSAQERGLKYRTIDQEKEFGGTVRKYPRRKLTMTQPIAMPMGVRLKRYEYSKEELLELWEKALEERGITVETGIRVTGLEPLGDVYSVQTSQGAIETRNVILALGRRGTPRRLKVPGEESERVLYQLIDAATYTNTKLLVVGGGDSAVEAAMALANQPGNEVAISYRRAGFFRIKKRNSERLAQYFEEGRIRPLFNSQVKGIGDRQATLTIKSEEGSTEETVPAEYIFVLAGGEPPYPLLKGMGIRFGGEQRKPALQRVAS